MPLEVRSFKVGERTPSQTYDKCGLVRSSHCFGLHHPAWYFLNKLGFLLRFEGLQSSLFSYAPELFVFNGEAVKFVVNAGGNTSLL